MIRVIHYLPNINCTSGIANLVMNYYRLIDKNKIQFEFIYFNKKTNNNFQDEIEKLGGSVHYIVPPTKHKKFKEELNKYFSNINKKYKNDFIIFHNHQLAFTILLYKILKKYRINNIIVHNHMTKFSDTKFKAFRNLLFFLPVKFLKVKYFSCSDDACKLICKYNLVKKTDIYVMNNGIDCDKFLFNEKSREKIRKQYNLKDSFVIGHIGRFEPVKNHKFIIELFEKICSYSDQYKLILVGTGSLKNKIENIVHLDGIDEKVIFLELRNDISDILSAMDCFILPSKYEGLGIAAIEAQANGLQTIISNSVPKEVVLSDCNQIDTNNINSWVEKIFSLDKKEVKLRKQYNLIVKKSKFNINNNVKELENEYYKIVKKGV